MNNHKKAQEILCLLVFSCAFCGLSESGAQKALCGQNPGELSILGASVRLWCVKNIDEGRIQMKTLIFLVLLLPQTNTVDSNAAFERLKGLVGKWQAETSMGKAVIEVELIAGGNTLLERETVGEMPPMITVYHLDGNRLLLTHHCMLGNQPRMQARAFNRETGELKFEFLDVTNLAGANAGHMRNARFRFVNANNFVSEWDFYENGQRKSTETFNYTRVR